VPHHAELAVAAVVVLLVAVTDLRGAIGFSSFGVLLYYFVANASAYRQPAAARRFPRWLQLLGCTSCLVLVATLPSRSVVVGLAVFAVGIGVRAVRSGAVG
jgi:APA family basic amino acid/polyamine antiporter